jgi:hypothetical protein
MSLEPLKPEIEEAIKQALNKSWSEHTGIRAGANHQCRSANQCMQTSLVICEKFGGHILRTEVADTSNWKIPHYYNSIGGQRYDFTADQFSGPEYAGWKDTYEDEQVDVEFVEQQLNNDAYLRALYFAFEREYKKLLNSDIT